MTRNFRLTLKPEPLVRSTAFRNSISAIYCKWYYKTHRRDFFSRRNQSSNLISDIMFPDRRISHTLTYCLVSPFNPFHLVVCQLRFLHVEKNVACEDTLEKASVSELFRLPSIKKQDTWYPTLRKTVWVLLQLHDFVKVPQNPEILWNILISIFYLASHL